jgi:hypothetical protein
MPEVQFPTRQPIGTLVWPVRCEDQETWQQRSAYGRVLLPTTDHLVLEVDNTTDLSFLCELPAYCLQGLILWKLHHLQDAELRYVGRLRSLRALTLLDTWEITDRGLTYLSDLVALHELDLTATAITDAAWQVVGCFVRLRRLVLWSTELSEAGLDHLTLLPALEDVMLHIRPLSGTGIRTLSQCGNLRRLEFVGMAVTADQMTTLQQALPSCTITTR